MNELLRVKGANGEIIAYDDRVVISRKSFGGFILQGVRGDRTYYYKDLQGIEYRKPGMINGYMKFIIAGGQDYGGTKSGVLMSKGGDDPNSVILRAFKKETVVLSEKMNELISGKLNEVKNNPTTTTSSNSSIGDELLKYKNLLDSGAISEDEYNSLKNSIINK